MALSTRCTAKWPASAISDTLFNSLSSGRCFREQIRDAAKTPEIMYLIPMFASLCGRLYFQEEAFCLDLVFWLQTWYCCQKWLLWRKLSPFNISENLYAPPHVITVYTSPCYITDCCCLGEIAQCSFIGLYVSFIMGYRVEGSLTKGSSFQWQFF